jgi:hypothetical protein
VTHNWGNSWKHPPSFAPLGARAAPLPAFAFWNQMKCCLPLVTRSVNPKPPFLNMDFPGNSSGFPHISPERTFIRTLYLFSA